MLLRGGAFSACNAALGDGHHDNGRFDGLIRRRPTGSFAAAVWCGRYRPARSLRVASVATGEQQQESSHQPRLDDRLRLGGLTEDGLSYKEKFIVRCYEVGLNKTATVETIANMLQGGCLQSCSECWFLNRWIWYIDDHEKIASHMGDGTSDVVEVETWYESEGRIGPRRDWFLKDFATGEVIGRATSKWVMMNQDTRRLQKVSDDVRDEFIAFCPKTLRLAFPEENNASLKKIAKLNGPAQYSKLGLAPRRADLDMNHHVNNVAYIGWALETMPQEIIDSHELQTITLEYRRECQQDDVVDCLTAPENAFSELHGINGSPPVAKEENDNLAFLHLLRLSNNGFEINRGRTVWRMKPAKR
ncbi:hypothetical protein CASFOL_005696 [Castilleja foliolosa]|uniref:Acyl-[acyl-carrier-protein] hydrolase n=1 Tax=Castilleja foliolosa TaxID=1961234 RepID=A0ABD3E4J5_9LAMI